MKKNTVNLNQLTIEELKKLSKEEIIEIAIRERARSIDLWHQINQPKPNSSNSSKPPSTDTAKEKAERLARNKKPKSNKQTGGQLGHQGKTLSLQKPDKIIKLYRYTPFQPAGELLQACQITDIKFSKEVTEYRLYSTHSKTSDTINTVLPTNYTSYSPSIKSLITYLSVEQAISEERIVRLFQDVFNLSISTGLVSKILKKANFKFHLVNQLLKQQVTKSDILGSDETFMNLNGKQVYLWNWNCQNYSYFAASQTRSYSNIKNTIPHFKGTLITDRLPVQLKHSCNHQVCTIHLQRDIKKLPDSIFKTNLQEILGQAQKAVPCPENYQYYQNQLKSLLDKPPPTDKLSITLFKSLLKLKDYLFQFLTNPLIPHHNNTTERELRKSKIKHKITGGFRTLKGFETYAKILSFIQTCRKQGQNVWQEMLALYENRPLGLKFSC